MENNKFHVIDYVVFFISLLAPLGIGIFFKIYDRNRQSTSEYLLGGRQMGCLVLGFSMMASFYNAVFLISAPAETYYFGTIWHVTAVPYVVTCALNMLLLVPFFRRSNSASGYEYLEQRYRSTIPRLAGAFGFSLHMLSFLAVVMYAPALTLNQVSGVNMNLAIVLCGAICTAYTFMGGLRAVLWADCLQTLIMMMCFSVMCVLGISSVGGWDAFTQQVQHGGRINYFNFNTDPHTRHTLLTQLIGGFFVNLSASNQMTIQRFKAASSTLTAQIALMVTTASSCLLAVLTSFVGLILYAYFSNCDPIVCGNTSKPDQLLPHFVMEVYGAYPGLPGCFIAAIFAAALSTVSSIVNSLALVSVEDFLKPAYSGVTGRGLSEHHAFRATKALTGVYGVLSMCLAVAAPYMGPLMLQVPMMLHSCVGAPMNVLFAVSIFWPFTNIWGATIGSLLGLAFGLFLALAKMFYGTKPIPLALGQCYNLDVDATIASMATSFETSQCVIPNTHFFNSSTAIDHIPDMAEISMVEWFGRLSYMWYPVLTWIITLFACILISTLTRLIGLPRTRCSYVYKEGLVYWGYDVKTKDFDHEADYISDPVVMKHFVSLEQKS